MKLLFCRKCSDIIKLVYEKRACLCGKTWGYIKDNLDDVCDEAYINGGLPIAIDNNDILIAQAVEKCSILIHARSIMIGEEQCKVNLL